MILKAGQQGIWLGTIFLLYPPVPQFGATIQSAPRLGTNPPSTMGSRSACRQRRRCFDVLFKGFDARRKQYARRT